VIGHARRNDLLERIVPPVAALLLIVVFATLGNWQLNRAAEKVESAAQFENTAPYTPLAQITNAAPFQRIESRGRYLAQRQVLVNNIIRNNRLGYFVITALELTSDEPLLIVNRGWIEKPRDADALADIKVEDNWRSLRGRAGDLPRVGIRSGEPFVGDDTWPRTGLYPTLADVSAQLGREVLPFALLLDPDADDGYMRDWQPRQAAPSTHYGYAVQWFALALAVIVVWVVQIRRMRRRQ
jgi:surfeit locus 1 family protein